LASDRSAVSLPTKDGIYLEFQGSVGYDLIAKGLEDLKSKRIRLCTVRVVSTPDGQNQTVATVYIPEDKKGYFLKKIGEYATEQTRKGNPRHSDLIRSIEGIRLAVLESFWQDPPELLPGENPDWCEVWLRGQEEVVQERFSSLCSILRVEHRPRLLRFPERTVTLVRASRNDLLQLILASPDIAEFRLAKETAFFWMHLDNREQSEWMNDLISRLDLSEDAGVSVCILDTGVNNGHGLLSGMLSDPDRHSFDPDWGVSDDGTDFRIGHGTLMAGVAAYGDLQEALQSRSPLKIVHRLESVKMLDPHGKEHDRELYGDVTRQCVSRVEIQAPTRKRVICMAVSSLDTIDRGRPSSWSGAIDALASGAEDGIRRLIIVAAGNADPDQVHNYPESNQTDSIHDPGQAWNALTVGAFTEKINLTDPALTGYRPVAPPGGLSPFSTTSVPWKQSWPKKPDVVFEGGNAAIDSAGHTTQCDDLSVLSTNHRPMEKAFGVFQGTSAASAKGAWFAAQVRSRYPEAWPETIRGLMVHSADWTEAMDRQFLQSSARRDRVQLIRVCGYGVPLLSRAIECSENSLTLISEAEIQPFDKEGGRYKIKEMHFYEFPWPQEELLGLGSVEVRMRVTLSYFVEPGPGEVGWKDRYRYPSYGLRFEVNRPNETSSEFIRRINKAAREEEENEVAAPDRRNWIIGSQGRRDGSIHSDILIDTAANVATCNLIGIYPVVGWWRERSHLQCWSKTARYSLIVSIMTPEVEVDIYTPIAVKVAVPITVR
jgi:hypothetical protein